MDELRLVDGKWLVTKTGSCGHSERAASTMEPALNRMARAAAQALKEQKCSTK